MERGKKIIKKRKNLLLEDSDHPFYLFSQKRKKEQFHYGWLYKTGTALSFT